MGTFSCLIAYTYVDPDGRLRAGNTIHTTDVPIDGPEIGRLQQRLGLDVDGSDLSISNILPLPIKAPRRVGSDY